MYEKRALKSEKLIFDLFFTSNLLIIFKMSDCLKDFEYYSLIHNSYVYGEIVGIQEENSYILKNKKDGTEEICESNSIRKITEISQNAIDNGHWEFIKGEDEFLEATIKEQKGLFIYTGKDILSIKEIQAPNAKKMGILDYLRGKSIEVGKVFE